MCTTKNNFIRLSHVVLVNDRITEFSTDIYRVSVVKYEVYFIYKEVYFVYKEVYFAKDLSCKHISMKRFRIHKKVFS